MKATINDLLEELKALRGSIDALRNEQRAVDPTANEINTAEALKIMHCRTSASLTALARLFPSIRVRRGIYARDNLIAALNNREKIRQSRGNR